MKKFMLVTLIAKSKENFSQKRVIKKFRFANALVTNNDYKIF